MPSKLASRANCGSEQHTPSKHRRGSKTTLRRCERNGLSCNHPYSRDVQSSRGTAWASSGLRRRERVCRCPSPCAHGNPISATVFQLYSLRSARWRPPRTAPIQLRRRRRFISYRINLDRDQHRDREIGDEPYWCRPTPNHALGSASQPPGSTRLPTRCRRQSRRMLRCPSSRPCSKKGPIDLTSRRRLPGSLP